MSTLAYATFGWLDWSAVAAYFLVVLGLAAWAKVRSSGSADYFLAGRSMGWCLVGLSMLATSFSTISFVAVPGEAFSNGPLLSIALFISPLFLPLAIWMFLRFFFLSPTFTAYEYLERRFNLASRLIGAGLYCAVRLLYAGIVFYAVATIFEGMLGWPLLATAVGVGGFTILYTTTGGMKAVMLTDAIQAAIFILGIGIVLFMSLQAAGFDVAAVYGYASARGHGYGPVLEPAFYSIDFHDRANLYLLLLMAGTATLQSVSADQSAVQRLLASRSYGQAKTGAVLSCAIAVPTVGMLWLCGLVLAYYYRPGGASLPEGIAADQVMSYFITTNLPAPLPGLVAAALLAAMMSTIDSTVNCLANVIHRDFLIRLGVVREGAPSEIRLCRYLSAGAGTLAVLLCVLLIYGGRGIQSSVLEISAIWGSLWGVLLMAFVLGVLVPRVSGRAMTVGLGIGAALNLWLPLQWYYAVPAEEADQLPVDQRAGHGGRWAAAAGPERAVAESKADARPDTLDGSARRLARSGRGGARGGGARRGRPDLTRFARSHYIRVSLELYR